MSAPEPHYSHVRRVVCAACRHPRAGVVLGVRHFDFHMHRAINLLNDGLMAIGQEPLDPEDWEEGFVDSKGEFLTREQAYMAAVALNQLIRQPWGSRGELFSENLY